MGRRYIFTAAAVLALAAALTVSAARVSGQNTAANASAPGGSAGKLSIIGNWAASGGAGEAGYSIEGGRIDVETKIMGVQSVQKSIVVDPPDGKLPYKPWALAERDRRWSVSEHDTRISRDLDPNTKCFPSGMMRVMYRSNIMITEHPGYILMRFEWDHQYRIVYTDGRPHLPKGIKLWYGDSRGRWEGDTLVVDVTNLSGYSWLSLVGDFITDDAHVLERYTLINATTLKYQATITDPNVYSRPWTMEIVFRRAGADAQADANPFAVTNGEIWENTCREGNRNLVWRSISPQSFHPQFRLKASAAQPGH